MLRSIRRNVAKNRMKKRGLVKFCKHSNGIRSYFAEHWKEYV